MGKIPGRCDFFSSIPAVTSSCVAYSMGVSQHRYCGPDANCVGTCDIMWGIFEFAEAHMRSFVVKNICIYTTAFPETRLPVLSKKTRQRGKGHSSRNLNDRNQKVSVLISGLQKSGPSLWEDSECRARPAGGWISRPKIIHCQPTRHQSSRNAP